MARRLQQDLLKSVWKRIKSLRSQCLKWNLFSVSVSCRDRHVAFPIESVGFFNLRGWISLTEKTLRSYQTGFYVHWAPLISVVKHFWQKCSGEPVFFPVHILHPPHHPRSLEALLQTVACRPESSDPSSPLALYSHLRTPWSQLNSGASSALCRPRGFASLVAFSLCASPVHSAPRCHRPVSLNVFAENVSLDGRQRVYFHYMLWF